MRDEFHILKQLSGGGLAWVESAKDLEAANERIKLLDTAVSGEYIVLCEATQLGVPVEKSLCLLEKLHQATTEAQQGIKGERADVDFYRIARRQFELSVSDKPTGSETKLCAGLAALTHAIENHLNQILHPKSA